MSHPTPAFTFSRFVTGTWVVDRLRLTCSVAETSLELDATDVVTLQKLLAGAALDEAGQRLIERLEAARMTTASGPDGESDAPALRQWEPVDLAFHRASRAAKGPTHRFRGQLAPESLLLAERPPQTERIELPNDLARWPGLARSFAEVLAARRTRRRYADGTVSMSLLGTFLHQVARIDEIVDKGDDGQGARRPYPSAGARHPLELYLLLSREVCPEISRSGLFHYRAEAHRLERVAEHAAGSDALLASVRKVGMVEGRAWVPVFITARMARLSWKYEGMAYSLALKELGGVFQTCYLVAEAMGLACCALGGGLDRTFAELSGCDPIAEPQIGELVLGVPAMGTSSVQPMLVDRREP